MTVSIHFESERLAVFHASGVLKREELDEAKHALHAHMLEHGTMKVLILIGRDFGNLEAFAQWDDMDIDHHIQHHVERMAIVGDLRWRDSALLFFISAVSRFPIEYFNATQETFARAWLEAE